MRRASRLPLTTAAAALALAVACPLLAPAPAGAASPGSPGGAVQQQRADTLLPGQSLERLVSPNGLYELAFGSTGSGTYLGITVQRRAVGPYAAFTLDEVFDCGFYGCGLEFLEDGTLRTRGRAFEQEISPPGTGADRLVLGDDGRVRLYDGERLLRVFNDGVPTDDLLLGARLYSGERLVSGDRVLVMQADGNLVLYAAGRALWSSRTGVPGSHFAFQTDSNAVVYTPANRPVFDARTAQRPRAEGGPDLRAARVRFTAATGDRAAWEVALPAGGPTDLSPAFSSAWAGPVLTEGERLVVRESRTSPNGRVVTVLQADGNLVTYRAGRAVWSSRTRDADLAIMQGDGNLVLYREDRDPSTGALRLVAVWDSRTGGNPGARAVTQDDGNLVVYAAGSNRPLFASL